MLDLKAEVLAQFDLLEKEKVEIAQQRESLTAEKIRLEERLLDLEKEKSEASKKVNEAGGVDEVAALRGSYALKLAEVQEELETQKAKKVHLIKWENRLVEIEARQKLDLESLTKAKEELSKDKLAYKEELKAEFLEALKKQMPQ